jgi:hypothetical protein
MRHTLARCRIIAIRPERLITIPRIPQQGRRRALDENFGMEEIGQRPMIVPVDSNPMQHWEPRLWMKWANVRNSSAVLCSQNFFRLLYPGASMRASCRSLATSIATQINSFRRSLLVGHGRPLSLCVCSAHSRYRRPSAEGHAPRGMVRLVLAGIGLVTICPAISEQFLVSWTVSDSTSNLRKFE